jgi:hypothetical protein
VYSQSVRSKRLRVQRAGGTPCLSEQGLRHFQQPFSSLCWDKQGNCFARDKNSATALQAL